MTYLFLAGMIQPISPHRELHTVRVHLADPQPSTRAPTAKSEEKVTVGAVWAQVESTDQQMFRLGDRVVVGP